MRRRDFTVLFIAGALWPFEIHAQQSRKIPRIGVLLPGGTGIVFTPYKRVPRGIKTTRVRGGEDDCD